VLDIYVNEFQVCLTRFVGVSSTVNEVNHYIVTDKPLCSIIN
jgi:hypothetical protein